MSPTWSSWPSSMPSYSCWATVMVFFAENRSFRPASCWSVDVMKGAAGFFLRSPRLLGVDFLQIDAPGVLERGAHRALGDLVERDPVHPALVDRQFLDEMPADRLAFPVRVGGDVERVDFLGRFLQLVEHFLLGRRDDVLGLEVARRVDAERGFRQIAHVAHRSLHHVSGLQILLDRLHLGGGFDHHQRTLRHSALLSPSCRWARRAVARSAATHRCPAYCRAHPSSSSASRLVLTRATG